MQGKLNLKIADGLFSKLEGVGSVYLTDKLVFENCALCP